MKGTDILLGLGRTYASAAAYSDTGRVVFPHQRRTSDQATVGEFRTAFIRSKGFRFEYREVPSPRHLRDASAARRFGIRVERGRVVDARGFEPSRESLHLTVASMTGITFGAAYCALRLLLPDEIGGRALSEAPSAEMVRTYRVEGKASFALRLKEWSAAEIVVDEDFVLRRVCSYGRRVPGRQATAGDPSRFDRVLVYEPQLFAEEPPDLELDS